MLRKGEVNRTKNAHWCVVSGSDVWLVDGAIPFGSAEQYSLPRGNERQIGEYQGAPVMWINPVSYTHLTLPTMRLV